jgi:hypothetical protein
MRRRDRYGQRISGLPSEAEGHPRGSAARTAATGASETEGRRRILARTAATSADGLPLQDLAVLLLVRRRDAMALVGRIEPGISLQVISRELVPIPDRVGAGFRRKTFCRIEQIIPPLSPFAIRTSASAPESPMTCRQ